MPDTRPPSPLSANPIQPSTSARDPALAGIFYALGAFGIWALAPVFFKALSSVAPIEILAHRIIWSMLLVGLLIVALRRTAGVRAAVASRRRIGLFALTTLLVSTNWLAFIWGIGSDHLVQISLGYYINPLVNVLLGVLFLGESLSRRKQMAVILAAAGVSVLILAGGVVPWLSLVLAFSFGFYALVRKKVDADPLCGFFVETALLAPFALCFLVVLGVLGQGSFGSQGLVLDGLLVGSGVVTAAPLILFMAGARRLQLSTIGLMQYLAPSGHLLLATLIYGEPFTLAHGAAFGFIWLGLALYSYETFTTRRRS